MTETFSVPLSKLRIAEQNIRPGDIRKDDDWEEFKDSVGSKMLEPLRVLPGETADGFIEVIDGGLRLRALQQLNKSKKDGTLLNDPDVECLNADVKMDPIHELAYSATMAIQRKNLTPQEWANVVERFHGLGVKQKDIGKLLGKSSAWVSMIKSGHDWHEQRKSTPTRTDQGTKEEEFECPACGNDIKRISSQQGTQYEVLGKERKKGGGKM